MQKLVLIILVIVLFSCNNEHRNSFTINGKVKNFSGSKIYLEKVHFGNKNPDLIDSAAVSNESFSLQVKSTEESLYRLRLNNQKNGFLFINDKNKIACEIDAADFSFNSAYFNSPTNISFKNFIKTKDNLELGVVKADSVLRLLQQQGLDENDSTVVAEIRKIRSVQKQVADFCFHYADTVKSPILALFIVTSAPVMIQDVEIPLNNLVKRFPKHTEIEQVSSFVKQRLAAQAQQGNPGNSNLKIAIGSAAPEITMPDTEGKTFSLSTLKGKYVLIDFWASWCGPCRAENPNVVAAHNKFKDKNFTVLGVSLDKDKNSWLKAIQKDGLTWNHISDLQFWNSAAVELYGFNGIPFNVLVDPEGKVIAMDLRGENLEKKLEEVLK